MSCNLGPHLSDEDSLSSTESSTETKSVELISPKLDLTKPEIAEVISTALNFSNHVVEIGTGEGKSVTLAVSAMLLSFLGFEADVVCYSEYLSERDYESFQSMFTDFGLTTSIRYGTFKSICEKFLNEQGNIRDGVISIMSDTSGANSFARRTDMKPRILLIDEVDVFFNKEFYANIYKPYAKLCSSEITALVKEMWDVHKSGVKGALNFFGIKKWPLYTNCLVKYQGWEYFIEETVKRMVGDLRAFDGPGHVYHVDCERNRIGYKDHDSIVYNINVGYQTMYAYFKEHESGKITNTGLDKNIYFLVDCGDFSYAAVPKLYTSVLGVSGTLLELSDGEKKVLRNVYNIKCATYLPSVYGRNKLNFDPNAHGAIKITNDIEYYKEIVSEIDHQLRGKMKDRAVLVFFETKKKVNDFLESSAMSSRRGQVRVMREEDTVADREQAVRQAVASKSITVLSRDFGRGTDFVCFDDELDASGGVHVIQTFVSLEVSEQTQIKGRTARQGNAGSYSLVLLDSELEAIQISADMIRDFEAKGQRYSEIDRMRKSAFNSSYATAMTYVDTIEQNHKDSQEFLISLYRGDIAAVKEFINMRNKSAALHEEGTLSRTICLIDATGSMTHLLDQVKMTVHSMFERARTILEAAGYPEAFEMQLAFYRNYSSGADVLEHSTWERQPENLRAYMNRIRVNGGQGREAVEIGLWHVNRELRAGTVTQVILIGDMPPNTREEVAHKRRGSDHFAYWSNTQFAEPTYYKYEMTNIVSAGVPIHALYVKDDAREVFKNIAKSTGGVTDALDIHSDKGAAMLTRLVTMRILEDVNKFVGGGSVGEKKLKEAYHSKYGFV